MHYEYDDQMGCIIDEPLEMSNTELDTIIRLIPHASPRQTKIIEGQIKIHKELLKVNEK